MNWTDYLSICESIVNNPTPEPPYDNPDYMDYTKLNVARMRRWIKTAPLTEETVSTVKNISQPQQWMVITEPWCGDAAHIVPIIYLMAQHNPLIQFSLQLRDSDSEINNYLTNGSKSIPILIVRDAQGKNLFHWGPRTAEGQALFLSLKVKNASFDEVKEKLQYHYNGDKSITLQAEIVALLKK